MAKTKNKGPKPKTEKKVNPFELKFNKKKHHVLGQKQNAGIMGRPGLSKKRAHEKRENTLGVDYSRVGVVNKVVDRRLGEHDSTKSASEKVSMRFAAEKMRNYKEDKFNLAEDTETLTHGGEALTAIQKYDRVRESDDEDEGDNIAASIVKAAHFGGGADSKGKSRQDVIADIISKTKQSRMEKSKAKDEQETMTENLDEKYRRLLGKVTAGFRPVGETKVENETAKKDDFDTLMLQMKFDADQKATPSERMKSEEEKAADEKAHLEELEQRRLARINAQENGKRHLPVDVDIDPSAVSKKKKSGFELKFDTSGNVINKNKIEKNSFKKVAIDSDVSDEEADPDDDDDEDLDDLIDGDEEDEAGDEEDEVNDEEVDEEEEESDVENLEDKNEEEEEIVDEFPSEDIVTETTKASDIPFVFEFPPNYKVLTEILKQYGSNNVAVVLERIVKCHHPGLKQGNKELMKKLFLYTLRFYDDSSKKVTEESVKMLGLLTKSLYAIMKFNIEYGVRCIRAFTRQLWKEKSDKKKEKKPASFSVIALLRLVAILFPTDYGTMWHSATAPAFMLASSCLAKGMVTSLSTLAQQILLLSSAADFVQDYVPEAMGFLQGALTLAVDQPNFLAPSNSFPISEPHCKMLLIRESVTIEDAVKPLKLTEIYGNKLGENDVNRCRVLRTLLANIKRFQSLYMIHEETFTTLFSPIVSMMKKIPTELLPASMAEELELIIKSTEAECVAKSKLTQLSRIKTEKSMMKMLEPRFDDDFNPERRRGKSFQGSAKEKQKLQYLYKKEMRGAVKELRKDTAYLGRKQRQETAFKDHDRRQKTKRLMASLASQQGEWNKEIHEGGRKKHKK